MVVTGFRGKVYQSWVESNLGSSLYELHDPGEVRHLAGRLDRWLEDAKAAGTSEVDLGDATMVPLEGIEALAQFLRSAADQDLWLWPDF
jgi:hypothetical protein